MTGTRVGLLGRGYMTRMLDDSHHLAKSNALYHLERLSAIYQVFQSGLGGKVGKSFFSSSLQSLTDIEAGRIVAMMPFMRMSRIMSAELRPHT